MAIDCGQSVNGIVAGDETIYFQFINDKNRDVTFVDTKNSFVSTVTIKDSEGRYIDSGYTTNCNGRDCDGNANMLKALLSGLYTVEMTASKDGGEFKVDMMCSTDTLYMNGMVKWLDMFFKNKSESTSMHSKTCRKPSFQSD